MPVSRVRHHFQVPLREGVDMVAEARKRLDGYAKRFKFIIADDIGKIEICGRDGDNLVMHQIHTRPEYPDDASRIIIRKLTDNAGWFDDLEEL
jgi:L-lysine 2,3-aminomutase